MDRMKGRRSKLICPTLVFLILIILLILSIFLFIFSQMEREGIERDAFP